MTKLWRSLLISKAVGHPRYCRRKKKHLAISESKISGPVERFLNQNSNTIFGVDVMKLWLAAIAMTAASSLAHATDNAMTVYQDPNCGCCGAWVEYMQDAGFEVTTIKTTDIVSIKKKLGVRSEERR